MSWLLAVNRVKKHVLRLNRWEILPVVYLPPDATIGAYFHGRGFLFTIKYFFKVYSLLNIQLLRSLYIEHVHYIYLAVDTIQRHLLWLTKGNIFTLNDNCHLRVQ